MTEKSGLVIPGEDYPSLMDAESRLWFTTEGAGVVMLSNPEAPTDKLQFIQYSGSELSDQVYGHHMDRDVYDGMDLALVCYDRKGKYLEYSGAFNPLYLVRNGEHMKKFKYRNLKETILKIQKESMSQQRAILDDTIEKWRGDLDQLDDILMIGRRF